MTTHDKQILALQAAARRQPDPVKRQRIVEKIREIKQRQARNNWLAQ